MAKDNEVTGYQLSINNLVLAILLIIKALVMVKHVHCNHCGKDVCGNHRLKGNQQYCSAQACQNARRSMWKRKHPKSQKKGKVKQQQNPDHEYMRKYRDTHPEYVTRNREQQKVRNRKRITTLPAILKFPGSLVLQRDADGSCSLVKIEHLGSVQGNASPS